MGLFVKALIFGTGYALGHPEGRRQFMQLREQANRLARTPGVVRAREHAWDVVGDQALAVKNRVAAAKFRRSADSGGSSAGSSGAQHHAQPSDPPNTHAGDTAVATAAAGTAAAADGGRTFLVPDQPTPLVPPAGRP